MTSACKLIAQIKATISIIQNFWEIRAARVQIESAPPAVVHESQYLILACVAFALVQARWFVVESELALLVEGVSEGKGCLGTSLVQVELTVTALVFEPNPGFFAAIALEGGICELELKLVFGMDWVREIFVNLHGDLCFSIMRVEGDWIRTLGV